MTYEETKAPAGAARWYWRHNGGRCGPVSWGALQALAQVGKIAPHDLVCHVGTDRWVRADEACADFEPPPELATQPAAAVPTVETPCSDPVAAAAPRAAAVVVRNREDQAGPAVAALACAAVGLFALGLLMGVLAVFGGIGALRGMSRSGNWRGSWIAVLAVVIGAFDVLRVASGLIAHAAGIALPVPIYGW